MARLTDQMDPVHVVHGGAFWVQTAGAASADGRCRIEF